MNITVTADTFRLAQVFTISRGSRTEAKVLTVKVEKDGFIGWGECVPYARYDETLESVEAEIAGLLAGRGAKKHALDFAADTIAAGYCLLRTHETLRCLPSAGTSAPT